jgi:hypothetical protein
MDRQYVDLTLEEVQTEAFEEVIYEVVEGWFLDDRMDFYDLTDRIDDHIEFDMAISSPTVRKCLPSGDLDQPIYKHVRKIARKAKRELTL